jgi:hypothetical protein
MVNSASEERAETSPDAGTALVALEARYATSPVTRSSIRPDPSFIMHLIAIANGMPQSRMLRRGTQHDAIRLYVGNPEAKARRPALLRTT